MMKKLTPLSIVMSILVTVGLTGCSLSYNHTYKYKSLNEDESVCAIEYTDSKGNKTSYLESMMTDEGISDKFKEKLQEHYESCLEQRTENVK